MTVDAKVPKVDFVWTTNRLARVEFVVCVHLDLLFVFVAVFVVAFVDNGFMLVGRVDFVDE